MGMSTIQFRPAPLHRAAIVRSHSPNWRSSAKPLPLTLAEFLVSAALVGGVVLALHGFPLLRARSPFSARWWIRAAEGSTYPRRLLIQRTLSHGAKMQRHDEDPHHDRDVREPLSHAKPYAEVSAGNR